MVNYPHNMFIGKYYHTLEEKKRISLPKAFRDICDNFVVTRGLDGGLFIFKAEDFQIEINKLEQSSFTKKRNRDFIRLMTNEAQMITPDKNGRVQLPEYLIEFAKLKKNLVIVGSLKRIEVWDVEKYHQYIDEIEKNAEEIAEQIEE